MTPRRRARPYALLAAPAQRRLGGLHGGRAAVIRNAYRLYHGRRITLAELYRTVRQFAPPHPDPAQLVVAPDNDTA